MASLLTSDLSSDEAEDISINKNYAESYNRFREKEVFQKLKDKYGDKAARVKMEGGNDSESSSSSEEEDEDAKEWTEDVERDFLRTLSCLKQGDSRIYDGKTTFFEEGRRRSPNKKNEKMKPMRLGDLERKVMLEKDGHYEELEDEELARKSKGKTYVEELEDIKNSFRQVDQGNEEEDDEDGAGLLKKKIKTKHEKEQDEADYKEWLAGKKVDLDNKQTERDLRGLKEYWSQKDLDEDEKFLRDYVLNKKYLDKDDKSDDDNEEDLSEDERTITQMEEFEHKYNFRFEEPDPEFVKRYPRTIEDSMRRRDNRRKEKREEVRRRKLEEKTRRTEELKQLKALKRKEIEEKLNRLKKVTGSEELGFAEGDVEGDFDPEEHDKRMAEVFRQYDEVTIENEDERPEFSDFGSDVEETLEVENWDDWQGNAEEEEDEQSSAWSADQPGPSSRQQTQQELIQLTKGRKRRRKSKFAEVLERKKPVFDPDEKTFEQYLEEYYQLDYEDMIGDLPCRFKYRQVEGNDFGLTTAEILSAPDRELNAWCSLKKTCMYRTEDDEKADVQLFRNRAKNLALKRKLLPSLFSENAEEEMQAEKDRKAKKGKKRRKRKIEDDKGHVEGNLSPAKKQQKVQDESLNESLAGKSTEVSESNKKRKKKKQKMKGASTTKKDLINAEVKMSDDRLKAFGLNPSQFKRKARKRKFKNQSI